MNRTVLGAFAALLLTAAGLFWWQGRAATEIGKALPMLADALPSADALPDADGKGLQGAAPPEANEATREQKRFDRLDKNRDNIITRVEMLTPRAAAFRKLDVDGNNLLSFEEWSVKTANRFKGADGNGDNRLDRREFLSTKPKPGQQPQCRCAKPEKPHGKGKGQPAPAAQAYPDSSDEELDPG
ncbi:MAG: hypothetical protein ABI673_04310 [Novosphingobium sp.]